MKSALSKDELVEEFRRDMEPVLTKINELASKVDEVRSLLKARPINPSLSQSTEQEAGREFEMLAERWKNETVHCSSVLEMAMHPAYQQIIGMGQRAVPFILRDLKQQPAHWFWALRAIAGEDPVSPNDKGDLLKMAEAWLNWGSRNGYAA